MSQSHDYDFNFFCPKSPFAKEHSRLILSIIIVWALAVFGFQILLKILEKPVPEPGYVTHEKVWPGISDGTASIDNKVEAAKVYLTVVGKYVALRGKEDNVVKKAFTTMIHDILPEYQRKSFIDLTQEIQTNKGADVDFIADALGLTQNSLLRPFIPYGLVHYKGPMTRPELDSLPGRTGLLGKYLIHYRSALTDSTFLGFPFHYFYASEFLLFLFIGLCLIYCTQIEKILKKYDME